MLCGLWGWATNGSFIMYVWNFPRLPTLFKNAPTLHSANYQHAHYITAGGLYHISTAVIGDCLRLCNSRMRSHSQVNAHALHALIACTSHTHAWTARSGTIVTGMRSHWTH